MEMIKKYSKTDIIDFETTLDNPRLVYVIGRDKEVYLEEAVELPREVKSFSVNENALVVVAQGNPVQLQQLDKKIKLSIKRVLRTLKRLS